MKWRSKRIVLAVLLASSLLLVFANVYASGYFLRGSWVAQYQELNGDHAVLGLSFNNNGQGMTLVRVAGAYDARLQTSHKASVVEHILWTNNHRIIQIYQSDKGYSRGGRLLAVGSLVGLGKLEVVFLQPRDKYLPARAIFKIVSHP